MSSREREEGLRRANRARDEGRVDQAVAEVAALVAAFPDDLSLVNTLGDLHVIHGEPTAALPLFLRVGDHYFHEGFYSKAVGVYRKILKFVPRDESMLLRLAEALAAQGLTVEAHAQFGAVEAARRKRGDLAAADDVALRLADLDPTDLAGRWTAARALAFRDRPAAVARYEALATEFDLAQRFDDALAAWRELIALVPEDLVRRTRVARRAWERAGPEAARTLLGKGEVSQHAPALALLTEIELRSGTPDDVRAAVTAWLAADRAAHAGVLDLLSGAGADDADRAWACVAVLVERDLAAGRPADAEHVLATLAATPAVNGPALVKWIEVAVLAHLDAAVGRVRARLETLPTGGNGTTARSVVEVASSRVTPHGAWVELFDACLGRTRSVDAAACAAGPVAPAAASAAPAASPRVPPDTAAQPEFIEVDLTAALNALSVDHVIAVVPGAVGPSESRADEGAGAHVSDGARAMRLDAVEALTLGQTCLAAGLIDKAREALRHALEAPDTAVRAALALADLHASAGEPAEACRIIERVLPVTAGRERVQMLAQLVSSLDATGDVVGARQRLRELADVVPDHPVVRAWREHRETPGR